MLVFRFELPLDFFIESGSRESDILATLFIGNGELVPSNTDKLLKVFKKEFKELFHKVLM